MRKNLQVIGIALIVLMFASCGGSKSKEVKLIPVKSGKDFQYIDQEGKIVINPQFNQATVFRNGLALVQTNGENPKWGFIGEDGKFVIPATYKSATVFSEDLAWVVTDGSAPTAINNKGEIKITLQDAQSVCIFKGGLAAFSVADTSGIKWGFVDNTGKVKITPQFTAVGYFNENLCAVANKDGKWGYIDKDGKIVINNQFDRANEFINGKAVVTTEDKTGVIDAKGKYTINPQFHAMIPDGDLFVIEQDHKWGWCDKDGKIIINPQFTEAYPFGGKELAPVQSGENYGFIDKEGKIAINPQFQGALPFNGKLALVMSNKKIGFIDKDGKYVINPQFDDVSRDFMLYLINGSSEFEVAISDKTTPPEAIAEDYLKAVKTQKFDVAKTLVTEESKATVDFMAQMITMGGEEAKKAATVKYEIKDMKCETKDNVSDCTCKVNDGKKEEEEKLHLVKKDGKWLVEQKKEGGTPSTSTENTAPEVKY